MKIPDADKKSYNLPEYTAQISGQLPECLFAAALSSNILLFLLSVPYTPAQYKQLDILAKANGMFIGGASFQLINQLPLAVEQAVSASNMDFYTPDKPLFFQYNDSSPGNYTMLTEEITSNAADLNAEKASEFLAELTILLIKQHPFSTSGVQNIYIDLLKTISRKLRQNKFDLLIEDFLTQDTAGIYDAETIGQVQETAGIVSMDIPDASYRQILDTVSYMGSQVLLFTQDGEIVCRINRLIKAMKGIQEDSLYPRIPVSGKDEIGILEESFNYFLLEIQELLTRKYELGQKIQRSQYDVLRAQINPHFLYNAFDLINLTSMKYGVPEISQIVLSLSRYYKLSLNHGEDTIKVRDEIDHIRAYIDFQNYRYQSHVQLETRISEEISELYIIHMILQPLVENSFLHGLQPDKVENGQILIDARKDEKYLYLLVEDNGIGGDLNRIRDILSGDLPETGYGIRNVNERIQLAYSSSCGLSYSQSEPGGLKVTIRLPVSYTKYNVFSHSILQHSAHNLSRPDT